jgi:hypothetical protein
MRLNYVLWMDSNLMTFQVASFKKINGVIVEKNSLFQRINGVIAKTFFYSNNTL